MLFLLNIKFISQVRQNSVTFSRVHILYLFNTNILDSAIIYRFTFDSTRICFNPICKDFYHMKRLLILIDEHIFFSETAHRKNLSKG